MDRERGGGVGGVLVVDVYALCIFQSSLSRSLTWLSEHSPISWFVITTGTADHCLPFVKTRLLRRLSTHLLISSHWVSTSVITTQSWLHLDTQASIFCYLFVSLITLWLHDRRCITLYLAPCCSWRVSVTRSWPTSLSVEANSTPHFALFPLNSGSRRTWLWFPKV